MNGGGGGKELMNQNNPSKVIEIIVTPKTMVYKALLLILFHLIEQLVLLFPYYR